MKSIPTISKYMSTQPHTISMEQNLEQAQKLMRDNRIRHLPVLKAGELVGILTDRDLKLYQGLRGADMHRDSVKDVCQEDVFSVSPSSPIDTVADEMAEKHYGCAVVMDNQKVVGIFTSVDGLRALSDQLHTRLK